MVDELFTADPVAVRQQDDHRGFDAQEAFAVNQCRKWHGQARWFSGLLVLLLRFEVRVRARNRQPQKGLFAGAASVLLVLPPLSPCRA